MFQKGILLIAFRRPFDIGDRIIITQPAQDESEGTSKSWFVEGEREIHP
jgi:small-conductance mechanosensitive channel